MFGSQGIQKTIINDFGGKVYCAKVPSGKLLVKRNKCTAVCGNSGVPEKIIVGDPEALAGSPEHNGAIRCLDEIFGHTLTPNGYKVLDSHIGLIYGEQITKERQELILAGLAANGYASDNVVLGVGSYNYQYVTRDTHGFAIKATYGETEDRGPMAIYKNPKTDTDGVKKSAKGLLQVIRQAGKLVLKDEVTWEEEAQSELKTVFYNGNIQRLQSLQDIREIIISELSLT
jgi:nicotinamide phosphoribosyltransferase